MYKSGGVEERSLRRTYKRIPRINQVTFANFTASFFNWCFEAVQSDGDQKA